MPMSKQATQRTKFILRGCLAWGQRGLIVGAILGGVLMPIVEYFDAVMIFGGALVGALWGGALGVMFSLALDFVRWVNTD